MRLAFDTARQRAERWEKVRILEKKNYQKLFDSCREAYMARFPHAIPRTHPTDAHSSPPACCVEARFALAAVESEKSDTMKPTCTREESKDGARVVFRRAASAVQLDVSSVAA